MAPAKHRDLNSLPGKLLPWFERHARDLPWRTLPADRAVGERPDPYRVWLCEIMMQQTTIPHGTPYFHTFLTRWPTIEALAAAKDEEVMSAWAGLGYYARARNLLKCAREVAARGGFPKQRPNCANCPVSGHIRLARSRRLPLTRKRRRWMAMSIACSRACRH